jgi:hypothetical protein
MSRVPRDFIPNDIKDKSLRGLTRAARLLSDVVSPPIIFAILGLVIGLARPGTPQNLVAAIVYGIFICLIPLGMVLYLYRTGRVSDLHMSHTRERHLPYLIGFLCASVAFLIAKELGATRPLRGLILASMLGLGFMGLINMRWLVSNHTASITMATMIVGFRFGQTAGLAMTPLMGLVFASRMYLRRHTLWQLIGGMIIGAASAAIIAYLGYYPDL